MDALDQKLNATFDGKVLRKDLLHRIMKAEREWVAWKVAALEAFKKDLEDCDQSTRDQLMAGVVEIKHVMKFKE